MSYCYGTMDVDGDYKGDLDAIVRVMNEWDWFGAEFAATDDSIIAFIIGDEYGAALPAGYFRDDGTTIPYDSDEADDKSCKEVTMETISREVSPLLHSGTLHLYAESFESTGSESVTTLAISSNGTIEANRWVREYDDEEPVGETVVYDPKQDATDGSRYMREK